MSYAGHYAVWTIRAGEDLDNFAPGSGALYKAIALDDGKLANNGREAGGLLMYGNKAAELITIGYAGVMKFVAGENITPGAHLTVREGGYFYIAQPGEWIVGRCLDSFVAKGEIGTGAFNFASSCKLSS